MKGNCFNIKPEYAGKTAEEVWRIVVDYVVAKGNFVSVTGISYSATFVGSCIFIKGGTPGTKRADKGEYLTGKDFVAAYDAVKSMKDFNINKIKPYIKRQQTPFIGLLLGAGVIFSGGNGGTKNEDATVFD